MHFDEIYSIHLVTQWIPCNQRYHGFRMQLWKHRGSRLKNFSLIVLSFYFSLQGTISRWPDLRWRESKLPSACNQQPAFGRAKFESLISCTNSQQIWTSLFQKDDSDLFQQSRQRGKAQSTVSESLIFDWYYFVQDYDFVDVHFSIFSKLQAAIEHGILSHSNLSVQNVSLAITG